MSKNLVEISGITNIQCYPNWCSCCRSTEIMEKDQLCIPCGKPPIECILHIHVDVDVCDFHTIDTCAGAKMVMDGIKKVKILYVADEPAQSVHSVCFEIPFSTFVLLEDTDEDASAVYAAIEEVKILQIARESFSIATLLFIAAKTQRRCCPCVVRTAPKYQYCYDAREEERWLKKNTDDSMADYLLHHTRKQQSSQSLCKAKSCNRCPKRWQCKYYLTHYRSF